MSELVGKNAVVTGGTDGIGAATALELRARGADVTVIGRSQPKANAVVASAKDLPGPGSLTAIVADLSLMRNVKAVGVGLADDLGSIDLLLNAVGILITRTAHTSEGIELDFAVGYLSRFVLLETLHAHGALRPSTRLITVAASGPRVPRYAQLEFDDLEKVRSRTGMRGHGQAQLANDLLTAQAASRYGLTAIGYGPGAVDTNIRREVSPVIQSLMKPFFARTTRTPGDVGRQLAEIFSDPAIADGSTTFYNRTGSFPAAEFIADRRRKSDLLGASLTLASDALRSP